MSRNFVKSMFKTSLLYVAGTVIARLVSFLLLPLYTKKISTETYGIYDVVLTYASIIVPLVGVNCWQGMLRFTIEESDSDKRHKIVSQGWIMLLLSLCVLTTAYLIFSLFVNFSHKFLVYLFFVSQLLQYFYLYTSRGFYRNKVYVISGIISAFAVAISSIICIYLFDLRLEALYISMIVSQLSQVIFIELNIHILKDLKLALFDKAKLIEIYKYCFPDAISNVFNWLLGSANRLIIVAYLGYAKNGVYAVANKFIGILSVFMTAFVLAFQESIYRAEKEQTAEIGSFVLKAFAKYGGFAVSVILLGTSIIFPVFVAGKYQEGYNLIPAFYAYFFISGFTWVLSSIVAATKKTQLCLYEKIITGILNFILVLVLIKNLGLMSSPVALFSAELVGIFVFKWLLHNKANCKVSLPVYQIVIDLGLILASSWLFLINNFWLNALGILVLTALFFFINRDELKKVCSLISKRA